MEEAALEGIIQAAWESSGKLLNQPTIHVLPIPEENEVPIHFSGQSGIDGLLCFLFFFCFGLILRFIIGKNGRQGKCMQDHSDHGYPGEEGGQGQNGEDAEDVVVNLSGSPNDLVVRIYKQIQGVQSPNPYIEREFNLGDNNFLIVKALGGDVGIMFKCLL